MRDYFYTISKKGEGLYKEKGSKFIGMAIPVLSEEDVHEELTMLRAKYHDARHHCYAWVLGKDYSTSRANDDGEPPHSAGDPILGQIKSLDLTNTLCVVVRYFGGTKLGVAGLINAYKQAAAEALASARRRKMPIEALFQIEYPYDMTSAVMKFLQNQGFDIRDQAFEETCTAEISCLRSNEGSALKALTDMSERGFIIDYTKK